MEAKKRTYVLKPGEGASFQDSVLWVNKFDSEPAVVTGSYSATLDIRGITHTIGCEVKIPCYTEQVRQTTVLAKQIATEAVVSEVVEVQAARGTDIG